MGHPVGVIWRHSGNVGSPVFKYIPKQSQVVMNDFKKYAGCPRKIGDLEMLNVFLKFFHSINFPGKTFIFPENFVQPARFAYNYLP